ncbi:MAG TPA: HAMP domain-containing sensor histidine kinase [Bacteroidia bacterium]|nr:HAMP domain-containing sensor histidine kinase [Bacteroidia bacterium]
MKNKTIVAVIGLFTIMLLGIILIQAWWIRRSLQLNEQAFNAAVYRSLEGVVKQVEEKENFSFIKNEIKYDTLIKPKKRTRIIKNTHTTQRIIKHSSGENIEVRVDARAGKQTQTIIKIEKNKDGTKTSSKNVVIASAAELPDLPTTPATPPTPPVAPSNKSTAIVEAPEPPVLSESELVILDDKKENVGVIIEKMMQIRNPDSVSIKPAELEKIISAQLAQNHLLAPFNFALYKKDSTRLYASKGFVDSADAYKINLYPNDLYGRNLSLALIIPEKAAYINGNVWWVFMLSLVFTSAILFLFIYSIRMLIRHKNLLEVKNDFINHMSHELKTPLATISLGADMLIGKTAKMDEVQIQKVASSIKKQSVRLHEDMKQILMNALLDNYQAKNEPFNLVEICKQTLSEMQFLLEDKKATLETHFEPSEIIVKGDADLWHKVFFNLLDNALKFSKENPEIKISITKNNQSVKIEVSDKGIGIAEKDLQHIFEKFYRSDYYKKSNIQGFGLGLSFVNKIVQLHKGAIRAVSKLDEGTTFIIELPNE